MPGSAPAMPEKEASQRQYVARASDLESCLQFIFTSLLFPGNSGCDIYARNGIQRRMNSYRPEWHSMTLNV
jgi:hypothetical protein